MTLTACGEFDRHCIDSGESQSHQGDEFDHDEKLHGLSLRLEL